MTTLPSPNTLEDEASPHSTLVGIDETLCTSTTKSLLPVICFVAPLSSNHEPPPEANTYKRSMIGFRYPFCNGSFNVSNKGLRNPSRPFNVLIRRTNKFGINIPITSTAQHIRRVKVVGFVRRHGIALLDTTTLHIVLLLLSGTLSLLHKT